MERIPRRQGERRYVGGWTPERVQTAAKLIEDLQKHPGWGELQALIDDRLDAEERRMVYSNRAHEHAEYARMAGFIRGLRQLKASAEQVLAEAKRIDEDNRKAATRQTAAEGT